VSFKILILIFILGEGMVGFPYSGSQILKIIISTLEIVTPNSFKIIILTLEIVTPNSFIVNILHWGEYCLNLPRFYGQFLTKILRIYRYLIGVALIFSSSVNWFSCWFSFHYWLIPVIVKSYFPIF
jgi:hypothetical protein